MAASRLRPFWGPLSPIGLTAAMVILVCDQAHKYWMLYVYRIEDKGRVELTPFLDLVMVWNQGISYGLFQQDGLSGQIALAGFALIVTAALYLWLARLDSRRAALAVGLIAGGAIGNAIDRLVYGAVADFISLHAFGFYWYVFNIADAAIVAGVAGLLYESLFESQKKASNAP